MEIQSLCDTVNQLIISEGIEVKNGRTSELVTARNIRYYRTIGIMEPPKRSGSKSTYDQSHVEAVLSIKRSQMAGLSLKEISGLQRHKISFTGSDAVATNSLVFASLNSIAAHSVSESFFPKFSLNARKQSLGWSAKIADCHLSGFGSPPNAEQLIAIEKILEGSTKTGDVSNRNDE
jgi:DNA-binding transcriptional MerR regulator